MKTKLLLIFCLAFFQFSFYGQTKKINGISFVASRSAIDSKHVKPVLEVNGNYVALMPFGFFRDMENPKNHIQFKSTMVWRN